MNYSQLTLQVRTGSLQKQLLFHLPILVSNAIYDDWFNKGIAKRSVFVSIFKRNDHGLS